MTVYLEQRYLDALCTTFYYILADKIWARWGGTPFNQRTEQDILTFIRDEEGAVEDQYEQHLVPARVYVQDERVMIEPQGFRPNQLPAPVRPTDDATVNKEEEPIRTPFQRWIHGE